MDECTLLKTIYSTSTLKPPITIGPGDDMGELVVGKENILCAVDQLVVSVHVHQDTSPELIGRKAVGRCFSDIAAMAAEPIASLMTACVPVETPNQWCEKVFSGAKEVAQKWGGPIIGGDISSGKGTSVFTVTAIARPKLKSILRTGAKEGDYVCVTGELGNSIAGHHLSFTPRISESQELLQTLGDNLHSMIDISDGLGIDASRLSSRELQLEIDTCLLPLRNGATIENAISDGEDYELLFTSAIKPPKELATVIGTVKQGNNKVITTDGTVIANCGWNHE
ncbi:MAG: thiamine-phosphate kinase [Phycisphaerales bacterium]|nr:thiamine-phosphate kinase [Phycisphaerales bacterium]